MKYSAFFTVGTRSNGSKFTKSVNDGPSELREFVRDVHMKHFEDCLPNDWIYQTISRAFDELEENSIDDITIDSDPYYSQLLEWMGNPYAHGLCNNAIIELGPFSDIYDLIGAAQHNAMFDIYNLVNEFIEEHKEDDDK